MSRDPVLAYNFEPITDYTSQIPFIDIARNMRSFSWNIFDDKIAAGDLDANGYPPAIIEGKTKIQTVWANGRSFYLGEDYVFTYDGEGAFTFSGTSTVSSEAGRHVFTMPSSPQNVTLTITETDPNATGEYLRNFSLVPLKYEWLHNQGEVFNPDWLPLIEPSRLNRIGAWMGWRYDVLQDWSDMPSPNYANWTTQAGMPVEIMVEFANQTGTDPWFVLPYLTYKDPDEVGYDAQEDYIRQLAIYIRDHLDPRLVAHVEYINEGWNGTYAAVKAYLEAQGALIFDTGDTFEKGQRFYGYQAARIFDKVFRDVFQEDSGEGRWAGVMGLWAGVPDTTNKRFQGAQYYLDNETAEGTTMDKLFSVGASTTYFGDSTVKNASYRAELLDHIATHTFEETCDWLKGKLLDASYTNSIPDIVSNLGAQKTILASYGLALVCYEGGQHVHHLVGVGGLTSEEIEALTNFFTGFVRSPQMADLYQALWDAWKEIGEGPFMQYSDVGAITNFGSWGLYSSLTDTNPRASLIQSLARTATKWFTDIVGRISLPDPRKVLAFIGGGKHRAEVGDNGCTIDGDASGETAVIMPGAPADYTCARDGTDTALYTYTHTSSGKEYKQRNCQAVGWSG